MNLAVIWCIACFSTSAPASHPPLRVVPAPSARPLAEGPARFADAAKGDDENDGSRESPWKTIGHSLLHLSAGETLYLRGGAYYENVHVSLMGRPDAPITVRSFPDEQAVLDGGLREFFEMPSTTWEPFAGGAEGEYRSSQSWPNLRHVVGSFGDSMIGLQSYYHAIDLRAAGELWDLETGKDAKQADYQPVYCGPGLWYDAASGFLHARLAHTHVPGIDNYRGETDPRKLPLVIAPFRSTPLHVDGARHVRFQDVVIRGGGYDTVVLDQAADVEFDNVTVWCGTYGLRATGVQRFKFLHSALYGSIAPWTFRVESGLQSYPGSPTRDVTRLNTHALLVAEAGREFSVYAYPFNGDWEIAHSEFTEGSDGLYLGGIDLKFHHNLVENMQDDGIYLSPMYPRKYYLRGGAELHLYQNRFHRCLTTLAFGGTEANVDTVYLYRNVFDLRDGVQTGRPSATNPQPVLFSGQVAGDHGSPQWSALNVYHNTFVMREPARSAHMALLAGATPESPHRVFNNIFLHPAGLPDCELVDAAQGAQADGNLYWQPDLASQGAETYFDRYRASALFEASKSVYAAGFTSHSLVADPGFGDLAGGPGEYRLPPESPAVDAGVDLPAGWPDPLRDADRGRPDLGALPLGDEPLQAGRSSP